ncbi:ribonuclease H-like domain-containing protein [Clohesyomyces aquaticus]|uniref:Ribonuclease H-like domain-containing protein n=1 Tax=Clohesyomyces aquaticus TaxID=1231657 RepID=A0A1Y1ZJR4_9PLEO|nr:ribonuclease H-like domain-containing protein [Clohesyomyces aquaticus]
MSVPSVDTAALAPSSALSDRQANIEDTNGLVDTPEAVAALVDAIANLPTHPPSLYIDLEGIDLSRHGTISILQLFVLPHSRTYLIDIHNLRSAAFLTPSPKGHTLKGILESAVVPKAFFDVRNDSDALYSLFNIDLAGICDIQLMELATRTASKRCVNGLARCMERNLSMTFAERQVWVDTKEAGRKLFAPERGGSYEVFNVRPMPDAIRKYCMQDVQYLPRLWQLYFSKMSAAWVASVEQEGRERVKLSQSSNFNGKGRHMALGPLYWK